MNVSMSIIFAVSVGQGNQNYPSGWKPIPPKSTGWAPIFALASKGGSKRALVDSSADTQPDTSKQGHRISSPMEVGDEIREMLQRGSLSVWRKSDSYSTDFMAASLANQRGSFFVGITTQSRGDASTATIIINSAKIASFERAVLKGKNIERMNVAFDSKNATCKYGTIAKDTLLKSAK
jgi:hypothetical protein